MQAALDRVRAQRNPAYSDHNTPKNLSDAEGLSGLDLLHVKVLAALIRGERATRKAVDDLFREAKRAA